MEECTLVRGLIESASSHRFIAYERCVFNDSSETQHDNNSDALEDSPLLAA